MINSINSELNKENTYKLIRYMYKNMPLYNQLKGSYMGMQFIMHVLGIPVKFVELWDNITDIDGESNYKNFTNAHALDRSTDINADRQKAHIYKSYTLAGYSILNKFLTSRFDVDLTYNDSISYQIFNDLSFNIVELINQSRPVTRVLNKLNYINTVYSNVKLKYFNDFNINKTKNLSKFTYKWKLTNNNTSYLHKYNLIKNKSLSVSSLCIPFIAEEATLNNNPTHKNTFFNLNNLYNNLLKSQHNKTVKFKLYVKHKSDKTYSSKYYTFILGKDITIKQNSLGFMLNLKVTNEYNNQLIIMDTLDTAKYINQLNDLDILLKATFNIKLGSDYIYN